MSAPHGGVPVWQLWPFRTRKGTAVPIPIFPRSGHFNGASAEVGFSPFFCLSHSRDFRYGPHNSLDLTCAGVARAVKIEVAREDLREAITYQKSTTSKPVSAAPRTSID